ncbi:MAG TPA: DUF6754 domain-containing protein [Anaerolineaceae bacterium]
MISLETAIGFGLVLAAAILMFLFSLPPRPGKRSNFALRPIAGLSRLRRALGLAVENGTRLHVSLGKSNGVGPTNAASLVGLSTLERIAQISSVSDRPPVASSGDGALSILSQDTLKAAYRAVNAAELYDPTRGRLTGVTPFSYVAGTLPIERNEQVSANVLVGTLGPEAALLAEASQRERAFTLAATDSLPGQAVLYAAAEEPLIGEELYAVPAYLQAGAFHRASLRAQDFLRWVIVGLIGIGAILALLGIKIL